MRTPSETPRASSSTAGAELAARMSYDVSVQELKDGPAYSVSDVAALYERAARLWVGVKGEVELVWQRVQTVRNLQLVPVVMSA